MRTSNHHDHSAHPHYIAMERNREATEAFITMAIQAEREASARHNARVTRGSRRLYSLPMKAH